jgi:trigger factor
MPEDTQDESPPQPQADAAEPQAEAEDAGEPEEQAGPKNEVVVEDAGTLKKKITVTVPRGKIDAKFDELFGELSTTAQVPGFRIGRAPRRLIEKRFGREVSRDVRNALLGESLGEAIEQSGLKTLGEPEIDLDAVELPDSGEMAFSFEVEVAPEFELPELKGIRVEKRSAEVTEERIEAFVERLRLSRARYEATEEGAREGDVVLVGARITGEGVEPVERHGLTLRVAAGQVEGLPLIDLGERLAGMKAGETATLTVTAPEAHPNEAWRGRELTVELTVSQVRRRILPDVDDDFAAQAGFDSLAKMREYMAARLRDQLAVETRRHMRDQACRYLLDHTEFELPAGVVARHTAGLLRRRAVDLLLRGVPREEIDEHLTELQAAASDEARRELKLSFILENIAEAQEVEVGADEVNSRIAQMASAHNRRPERVRQELQRDGSLEQVAASLREEKVLERLLDEAEVVEVAEEKPPAEAHKAKKKSAAKKSAKKPAKKSAKKSAKKPSGKSGPKAAGRGEKPGA